MNQSDVGSHAEERTVQNLLHRASCIIECVAELCFASDNPCEGESLKVAAEMLIEAHDLASAGKLKP